MWRLLRFISCFSNVFTLEPLIREWVPNPWVWGYLLQVNFVLNQSHFMELNRNTGNLALCFATIYLYNKTIFAPIFKTNQDSGRFHNVYSMALWTTGAENVLQFEMHESSLRSYTLYSPSYVECLSATRHGQALVLTLVALYPTTTLRLMVVYAHDITATQSGISITIYW